LTITRNSARLNLTRAIFNSYFVYIRLRFIEKKKNYVTKQKNYLKKKFKLRTSSDKNLIDMIYVQVLMK